MWANGSPLTGMLPDVTAGQVDPPTSSVKTKSYTHVEMRHHVRMRPRECDVITWWDDVRLKNLRTTEVLQLSRPAREFVVLGER